MLLGDSQQSLEMPSIPQSRKRRRACPEPTHLSKEEADWTCDDLPPLFFYCGQALTNQETPATCPGAAAPTALNMKISEGRKFSKEKQQVRTPKALCCTEVICSVEGE